MIEETLPGVLIVGCGAMGSIYAALLADAGCSVTAVSRNAEHAAAIVRDGLRVSGASGDRRVALEVTSTPPARAFDLVVVAVKASDVADAAKQLEGCLSERSVVLALQNGVGSGDDLADVVGRNRVLLGIAGGFGAEIVEPGHVLHTGMQVLRFGALSSSGLAADQLQSVANLWTTAGFSVETATDIVAMQWEKLICNVAFSAPCALTGLTVGEALADPDIGPVCLAAAREAFEVARGAGVAISVQDPEAHVRSFASNVAGARPSLLQDLDAGRRTEIDVINGAVVRAAEHIGRSAPVNQTLTALVRQREAQRHDAGDSPR